MLFAPKAALVTARQHINTDPRGILFWIGTTWLKSRARIAHADENERLFLHTAGGDKPVNLGDWIVRDAAGLYSVMDSETFEQTFAEVEKPTPLPEA